MNLICFYQKYLEPNTHLLHMIEEIATAKRKILQRSIILIEDIEIIRKTIFVSNITSILLVVEKEMNFHIVNMRQDHYSCQ